LQLSRTRVKIRIFRDTIRKDFGKSLRETSKNRVKTSRPTAVAVVALAKSIPKSVKISAKCKNKVPDSHAKAAATLRGRATHRPRVPPHICPDTPPPTTPGAPPTDHHHTRRDPRQFHPSSTTPAPWRMKEHHPPTITTPADDAKKNTV